MFNPVVVIPVYNHPKRIAQVVSQILGHTQHCILVNDGSDAQCTRLLRQLATQYGSDQITLVEHNHNQGKGAAVMTGMGVAFAAQFTHVLQIDADGQHQLSDIEKFMAIAQHNPTALVCGCPKYDASVPKRRLYARYLTHVWVWINTLSFRIKDSMCGFRVYPLKSIVPLYQQRCLSPRMGWDIEIIVRADWERIPIINVPTRVNYPENGVSHFMAFKDNVLISWMHARLFFGMLRRSPRLLYRSWVEKPHYEE
jgi:glycosyltransferase involved in cell wall biosynthesis